MISALSVPIFLLLIVFLFFTLSYRGHIGKFKVADLFGEKIKVVGEGNRVSFGGENSGPDDLVDPNGDISTLLREYHYQGLQQSKISFWFSIISATIGFLVIIYAISMFISSNSVIELKNFNESKVTINQNASWFDKAGTPIFTLICGVIIDAVAGLFFVQSNKARQLMSEFFDRLRVDRKLDESLKMIGSIEDKEIAGRVQALMAINLAEIQLDGPVFERVITRAYTTKSKKKSQSEKQPDSPSPK